LYPNGQCVDDRHTASDASYDDGGAEGEEEGGGVELKGDGGGEDVSVRVDQHQQVGDRDGMREVDEVGVFSERLKGAPERVLRAETREERKEGKRCADRVENAERRELMRCVDRLERGVPVDEDQLVIPREEQPEAEETECIETARPPLDQRAERVKMQGEIAAEQEDKDVVHDPIV